MFAVEIGGGATANVTPHYAAIKLARAVISCCRPQSCGSPTFTYVCAPTRRTHDMLFSAPLLHGISLPRALCMGLMLSPLPLPRCPHRSLDGTIRLAVSLASICA